LASILKDLETVEYIDPAEVMRLKDELEQVERDINLMDLEAKISQLEVGSSQQNVLIAQYEREFVDLEKDVINVEEIRAALPPADKEHCYNYVPIETSP
jgi:hypothetical protein